VLGVVTLWGFFWWLVGWGVFTNKVSDAVQQLVIFQMKQRSNSTAQN